MEAARDLGILGHRYPQRPASQIENVAATVKVAADRRPGVCREGRSIGQHQEVRIGEGLGMAQRIEIHELDIETVESLGQQLA